jgi:hypothetical protein
MAAGPAGPLLVQLDDWIMAVEPDGRKRVQAWRNGGETLVAPTHEGRALVMTQDRRLVACAPGEGAPARAPALCRLTEMVSGDACVLGARVLSDRKRAVVLLGLTDPRADTNIKCEVQAVLVGLEDLTARALAPMGGRMPRLWGVDEKRGCVMVGSMADAALCARVAIEDGARLPDETWLPPSEPGRVVCGDCSSRGRWCVAVEQARDPDEPDAPVARSILMLSAPGKLELRRPIEGFGEVRAAAWSPDGARVALRSDSRVFAYTPGDEAPKQVCGVGPMCEMAWWPAGGLALAEGRVLRMMDL